MNASPLEVCSHGRLLFPVAVPCIKCDIVWYREMLAIAEGRVAYARAKLDELNAKRSNPDDR